MAAQLSSARAGRQAAEDAVVAESDRATELETALHDEHDKWSRAEARVAELDALSADSDGRIAELEEKLAASTSTHEEELNSIRGELDLAESRRASEETTATEEKDELSQQLSDALKKIAAMETELAEQAAIHAGMSSDMSEAEAKIADQASELAELQTVLASTKANEAADKARIAELEERLEQEVNARGASDNDEIARLTKELESSRCATSECTSARSELNRKLEETEAEVVRAQESARVLEEENQVLRAAAEDKSEVDELNSKSRDLERNVEELTNDLDVGGGWPMNGVFIRNATNSLLCVFRVWVAHDDDASSISDHLIKPLRPLLISPYQRRRKRSWPTLKPKLKYLKKKLKWLD